MLIKSRSALRGLACAAFALAGSLLQTAHADWSEMSARLPAQTNAVVAINVDGLLASPLAAKENWARKWEDAYDAGAVPCGRAHSECSRAPC